MHRDIKEAQQRRRAARRLANGLNARAADSKVTIADAAAFARGCKPSDEGGMGGSDVFTAQAILYKWSGMRPQSSDRLVRLDIDLIHVIY